MKIINKKISELNEAQYNPRELTKAQHESLKSSLKKFGFVNPLLINKHPNRKDVIIGGHQRVRIWAELGNDSVPCVEIVLDPDAEKELNVRLNKNNGQWDWEMLANNFDPNDLLDWGFDESELSIDLGEDDDFEEEQPEIKFSEVLNETNNYVVLFFDNDVDWLQALTHFDLESVSAKRSNGKPWSKGIGRVLSGASYLKKITQQ
jgi:ParB-like chromosome segregation protein Spo0J